MIFATGITGTIGKFLSSNIHGVQINLEGPIIDSAPPKLQPEDSLIHLAGIVGPKLVDENPQRAFQVNVLGTVNLADSFLNSGGGRFIYVSTSHVYGKSDLPLKESSPVRPINNYANQKLEAEDRLRDLFQSNPDRLCVVRVFSVLDWNVGPFTLGGAISRLTESNSNFVLKNADDTRDFLTPKTIAETLELIAAKESMSGTVNLCSARGLTVREAALIMLNQIGLNPPSERIQGGNSSNPYIVGDNSKLKEFLPDSEIVWTPSTYT